MHTLTRPVLFPAIYPWLLLAASLDVMLTWVCLAMGGTEFNPIAAVCIDSGGMHGALALKFSCLVVVVLACEAVGRRKFVTGQRLAVAAVALNVLPVGAALLQLGLHGADYAD
ncbi:MAG: hypothetical protein KF787_02145 [Phycisphaeraceae bacterium]|nr:hypothetical protein [Phycisphaerae bacterium]MBX3391426.1 hypothetical protein [Phycisphaeraceae bacterium]